MSEILIDSFLTMHTQICPLQRLIGEPDLKPTARLLSVEPGNGETSSVHRDRIANMTVPKDRACI
jgi:hypothetical protein